MAARAFKLSFERGGPNVLKSVVYFSFSSYSFSVLLGCLISHSSVVLKRGYILESSRELLKITWLTASQPQRYQSKRSRVCSVHQYFLKPPVYFSYAAKVVNHFCGFVIVIVYFLINSP